MQKRILVVDDDTMNLVRTKMILEKDYRTGAAGGLGHQGP